MRRHIPILVCALMMLASASAQHFELSLESRAAADALVLDPNNSFDAPYHLTTVDRALRAIERQIEEKRAAEEARSPLDPLRNASFWKSPLMKLIPVGGGPERYPEDPYVMANYLTVARRQSDYQLKLSDERTRLFFSK